MFFEGFSALVGKISIHNLLCHNSGLKHYEDLIPQGVEHVYDEDILEILRKEKELLFSVGERYDYNNGGYCLLRLIIEKVSGLGIDIFLNSKIFKPLAMNNSFVKTKETKNISNRAFGYSLEGQNLVMTDQDLTSTTVGDGGIYSSLVDLKKWTQVFTTNKLLSDKSISSMLNKHVLTDEGAHVFYGYGLFIGDFDKQHIYHGGSSIGFHTAIYNIFEDNLSVIFLSNRSGKEGSAIAREIVDLLG